MARSTYFMNWKPESEYREEIAQLESENARLREHIERLTHLLRESAKGNQWPSPLEIDAALNKSQDIFANASDHRCSPEASATTKGNIENEN